MVAGMKSSWGDPGEQESLLPGGLGAADPDGCPHSFGRKTLQTQILPLALADLWLLEAVAQAK